MYYALCVVGWMIPVGFIWGLFRIARSMREHAAVERRGLLVLIAVAGIVVLLSGYLYAYPLAIAYPDATTRDLFVPADWAYDHTVLRHPLRLIGVQLGVAFEMEDQSHMRLRNGIWGATPPVLYAAGWLAFALAIIGCAAWGTSRLVRFAPKR